MESTAAPTILTIGYSQHGMEYLVQLLQSHAVEYVVDVRSAPYSKFRPEFTQPVLAAALEGSALPYIYMGDLVGGRPDDPTCYRDGKVDYGILSRTDRYKRGIERLEKAWRQGLRVCLLCAEGRPEECHRSKLIGETLARRGIPVEHINADGTVSSQVEVMFRLSGGQQSLFAGEYAPPQP